MPERIAIMLHHGLGDVIMSLPALYAADRLTGASGVYDLVVRSQLEAQMLADIAWQGKMRFHLLAAKGRTGRVFAATRAMTALRRARPEIFVTPHVTSAKAARKLAFIVGARRAVLTADSRGNDPVDGIAPLPGEHKSQLYARYLHTAGLCIELQNLAFPPLIRGVAGSRDIATETQRRVILAPAVGAPQEQHKRWPSAAFAKLANQIAETWPDAVLELAGAQSERATLQAVFDGIDPAHHHRVLLRTEPTPHKAAEAMMGAACVVTACSGASHLAAWAGVPIIGIYGPTNPGFTGPFSRQLHVVRKNWACSPCYRPGLLGGCGTPVCMTEITVEEVLRTVGAALANIFPLPIPILKTTLAQQPDRRELLHGEFRSSM